MPAVLCHITYAIQSCSEDPPDGYGEYPRRGQHSMQVPSIYGWHILGRTAQSLNGCLQSYQDAGIFAFEASRIACMVVHAARIHEYTQGSSSYLKP